MAAEVGSIRVVLADDHEVVREGVRSVLTAHADIRIVAEAADGEAAIRAVTEHRPDVAVMDVTMPDLNGMAAAQQVAALGLGTKVIALSMHTERPFIAGMLDAGAKGYLLKNTAAKELAEAIRAVMRGETFLSPQAADVLERGDGGGAAGLTPRERDVLRMLAEGKSSKEIAEVLFVSVRTVEAYRAQLMDKLNIRSVAGLTKFAIRHGLSGVE